MVDKKIMVRIKSEESNRRKLLRLHREENDQILPEGGRGTERFAPEERSFAPLSHPTRTKEKNKKHFHKFFLRTHMLKSVHRSPFLNSSTKMSTNVRASQTRELGSRQDRTKVAKGLVVRVVKEEESREEIPWTWDSSGTQFADTRRFST